MKTKKPFVSLNDEVTIIHESLTTPLLAQVDKALSSRYSLELAGLLGSP